ncbi:two-component hybrid sensor and regulator [Fulvivirga imtechensis AK7]|uniref:histidine kinase n=2 Tax=Fulvivirga TaxID=396811 RepID=L8JR82_9BACT|nr:two-component hybrid sensor and regulator [Fulvivirga imtechensis AK7]
MQEFLYYLEKVESSITDIEAAHRGFVITGNDVFLDPMTEARSELAKSLNIIDSLSQNNTGQKVNLSQLRSWVQKKIEISNTAISLRRNEEQTAALRFISTGRGKNIMDSIRIISKALESEQMANINSITNRNEHYIVRQNTFFLIFTGFVIGVVFLFYIRIRNDAKTTLELQKKQDILIQKLNHQNRQLDDFAHLTSHNIRSPASNISSLISLLNEDSTVEDYQLIFQKLKKVSQNLNETLNELLEMLQVKKSTSVEREELQFEEIYNKVVNSLQGDILMSGAVITTDFRFPVIIYPKAYLESIFHNFLSNAIKYRSPDRTLHIHVETDKIDGYIQLRVTDNGQGIDLNRYGNMVFGLRNTFHSGHDSKGIGLFMTKTQVEALGGKVEVQSNVNKGSSFIVFFDKKSTTTVS